MSMKTFDHSRTVDYALCDHRGQARLSYLLAVAQQISMEHCNAAGVGGHWFWDKGYAFLLAKLHLEIPQVPVGGQVMALHTRPNLPSRAQFRRQTTFAAQDGSLLARMDARWVLVDLASRRLVRRLPDDIQLPFLDAEVLEDFRPSPPASLEPVETVRVQYAMLDINGHVNNATYGDMICNLLEERLLDSQRLQWVDIFYHREALPGDQIQLYRCLEGDTFFIRGCVGEAICFEAAGALCQA